MQPAISSYSINHKQLWNYIDFEYKGQSDLFNEEVCHLDVMYIDIMYIIGYILQDKYIHDPNPNMYDYMLWIITYSTLLFERRGWVGLWGFLWWAPSAKRKDHHGVSSGWSSVWHRSNTGLSSTQYEQIPIILGVWPFWLTPFFFRSITFWRAYG